MCGDNSLVFWPGRTRTQTHRNVCIGVFTFNGFHCLGIVPILLFFLLPFSFLGGGAVVGAREFWAMGLIFFFFSFIYIGDWILVHLTLEHYVDEL